jgi:cell division septation protein DedD
MATNPEQDEYLDEDERDDIAQRSIFSAGWFRALLVLTVLAIVVVVSLPYLLNWLEPTPVAPPKPQTKASEPAPAPVAPAPTTPAQTAGTAQPAKPETTAPPTTAQTEAPKPAPAAPTPADRPLGTAPLPVAPAQAPPASTKAAPAKPDAVKPPAVAAAPKRALTPAPAANGSYWIQVGAFVQEKNAEALAKTLRAEQFPVEIARLSRGVGGTSAPVQPVESGGQNQLVITGSTPDAVNAALKGKGTAQVVKGGIVVNPAYDLETAMSLSSQLKKEGFKVIIRRARSGATTAAPATGSGITYHVVRVGGFADRAKAQQARADLEAKGHAGFVTQGAPR